MKTFDISIPPTRPGGLTINLTVEAMSWMDALRLASTELRDEMGLDPDAPRDDAIIVTDVGSGRQFRVESQPDPDGQADTTAPNRGSEDATAPQGEVANTSQELPAARAVQPPTRGGARASTSRRPRSSQTHDQRAAPAEGRLPSTQRPMAAHRPRAASAMRDAPRLNHPSIAHPYDHEALNRPRADRATARRTSPEPSAGRSEPQSAGHGKGAKQRRRLSFPTVADGVSASPVKRAAPTSLVDAPPELDEERETRPQQSDESRAVVNNDALHKVDEPTRIPSMDTIQHARAVDLNATILDGVALTGALVKKPTAPPIINSNALKKVRTIVRPGQGQVSENEQYFRPVSMLGDDGATTLIDLVDGAVNMAYDHVPCEAAQCLMFMENRKSLFVAAARGTFARQVTNAYVQLPATIDIDRLSRRTQTDLIKEQFELGYVKDGDDLEMEVITALWVPVFVEREVIAIMLVANSKHRTGFSVGELRGAEYLADTLGTEIDHFLNATLDD